MILVNYFVHKIDTIRSDIEACRVNSRGVPDDEVVNEASTFGRFHLLSESQVLDLVLKSRRGSD